MKTFDQIREASIKSNNVLSENILSRLTGGHGRYMKRLKNAYDHHRHLSNGHESLEDKLGRTDGSHEFSSDREEDQSFNHYMAHEDHGAAADDIKKYAYHVKKHKLTSAPKKTDSEGHALHKRAQEMSQHAHYASHLAIKSHTDSPTVGDRKHMDHVKELSKALGGHGSDQHHTDLK